LNQVLTHRYWAGIRDCTSAFAFAVPCVFVKQSSPPGHCGLPPLARLQAWFVPKIHHQFAEFPRLGYPKTPLLSQHGYLFRILVRSLGILTGFLFTGSWNRLNPACTGLFCFHQLLLVIRLHWLARPTCVNPSRSVRNASCVAARILMAQGY
jgi:hypothetical protein